MYNLCENIYALCNEQKITPGALCGELGFRRSVLSDLKNGRKKIARYNYAYENCRVL